MKDFIAEGRVSSIYPERGTARVILAGTKTVTSELFVLTRGTQNNKDYWMPSVGEQVVCLFVPNNRGTGYVLGCGYNNIDQPPVQDESKRHLQFEDQSFFEYDSKTHTLVFDFSKVVGAKVIFRNCQVIQE